MWLRQSRASLAWVPWWQGSWGQHGAHMGPTGPIWAPCWPHGLCYLGYFDESRFNLIWNDGRVKIGGFMGTHCLRVSSAYCGYGLSQWETTLQGSVVSHWLSPYLESPVVADMPWGRWLLKQYPLICALHPAISPIISSNTGFYQTEFGSELWIMQQIEHISYFF